MNRCSPPKSRTADAGIVERLEPQAGEDERGRPSLGPLHQQLNVGGLEIHVPPAREQLSRLGRREGEVARPQLDERAAGAQSAERERRVDAGQQNDAGVAGQVEERALERRQGVVAGHGMEVVEDEDEGPP